MLSNTVSSFNTNRIMRSEYGELPCMPVAVQLRSSAYTVVCTVVCLVENEWILQTRNLIDTKNVFNANK
jgi:hypothetical protein